MRSMVKRFRNDEAGLELSEYAIMAALIVVALLVIIEGLSGAIGGAFTALTTAIEGPAAPPAP